MSTGPMPEQRASAYTSSRYDTDPDPTAWVGWIYFAAAVLVVSGIFHAIEGLVALFKDDIYAVAPSGLVVSIDYSAWGWLYLAVGAALIVVGMALFSGQTWARVVAIILAALSAIANFLFIPAYPVWGLVVIALDVMVIYALCAHGREVKSVNDGY
jgi:hypothetical protein